MSGSAAPIALTITANDQTGKTIGAINKRVAAFGGNIQKNVTRAMGPMQQRIDRMQSSMRTFAEGTARVSNSFRGLARNGQDAFQKIGQIVPVLGVITGAASIAGMSRMVSQWSEWGLKVNQTARNIGMGAKQLTGMQGAATLAGGSADAMAGGLQNLGQAMYDAIGGRAPEAIVMFRTLGIAFQDASGLARKAADVMPEIADKIASIRDPFARAQVGVTLLGGAWQGLEPLLVLGSKRMRELQIAAEKYSYTTDASIEGAKNLALSQREVGLSVDGLRNRIAERLAPVLTPMLQHMAQWIATNPAVTRGINWLGMEVERLGHFLETVKWDVVEEKMEAWGEKIEWVVDKLGGPATVIGDLMKLMVVGFAAKVITPFITLALRIGEATAALGGYNAASLATAGPRAGGLGGGISKGLGIASGLNLLFDMLTGRTSEIADENLNRPGSFLGPKVPEQTDTRTWYEKLYKPGLGMFRGPSTNPTIQTGPMQPSAFANNNPSNLAYFPGQPGLVGRNGQGCSTLLCRHH